MHAWGQTDPNETPEQAAARADAAYRAILALRRAKGRLPRGYLKATKDARDIARTGADMYATMPETNPARANFAIQVKLQANTAENVLEQAQQELA